MRVHRHSRDQSINTRSQIRAQGLSLLGVINHVRREKGYTAPRRSVFGGFIRRSYILGTGAFSARFDLPVN